MVTVKLKVFDSGLVSHLQISPNFLKTGGESDLKGSNGPLIITWHISSSSTSRVETAATKLELIIFLEFSVKVLLTQSQN